ncbi:MAG: hypothetical protein B7Z66_05895 [Chromatiales bacterium 21-64-14]|nr:MAG: hypothetical protein B7Z66_05895 [Chromatiales bacterium 21-64-14]HQU15164.1 hypothetical protein [Gammaproteobacteria bacterium]
MRTRSAVSVLSARSWCTRLTSLALLLVAVPAHGSLLLSEVLYDAVGSDNGGVFVELSGAPGTSLAGVSLEGVNGADGRVYLTLPLSGVIPASGLFVVADDAGDGSSGVARANLITNFDFQNGPDSIVLRMGATVLDALGYGTFPAGSVFAGEGNAAPDGAAGQSLARIPGMPDTGDNRADFRLRDLPTPGSNGVSAVPIPPAGALFLTGATTLLVPLLGRRRRA